MPAHDPDATTRAGMLSGSTVVAAIQSLRETVGPYTAAVRSRTIYSIRNSRIYRWFTAPPEPEVIVIDLRETYLIAPVLALLDRTVAVLRPWFHASQLKRGTDILARLVIRAIDTRLGRTIVAVFEPPELLQQPDHENQHGESDGDQEPPT